MTSRTGGWSSVCATRGIGIPKDEQSEVFRKFVRGAAATASAVKGTGLGLTLVRQIVEAPRR